MIHSPSGGPESLPTDDLPEHGDSEPFQPMLSPGLISIFGLRGVLGVTPRTDAEDPRIYRTNMPELAVQPWAASDLTRPLSPDAQRLVHARAQTIATLPGAGSIDFEYRELFRFQKWLDAMALGKGEAEIGARRSVSRSAKDIREYFGVPNQAGALYAALLHGYVPNIPQPATARPTLHTSRALHLYLAALGFEAKEAADLADQKITEVKPQRLRATRDLGATAMTQAIAHAFWAGYFSPLPAR